MTVLGIIGGIVLVLFVIWFVKKINLYSYKRFRYTFFNARNVFIVCGSYLLLFFGSEMYKTALEQSGDTLNGILLICFGMAGLFYTLFYNISRTNLDFGLFMSIIQYIIYIPITVIGVLTVIVLLAFFVNTRPVYHINGR